MSLWALEWRRWLRTSRWLAVVLVFAAFGVSGPVLARYLPDLVKRSSTGGQLTIVAKPAVPSDGIAGYAGNALQIGLLVAVILAGSALALDAKPGLAAFYRTRVRRRWLLVVPRWAVASAVAVVGWLVGCGVAWLLTDRLIGVPPGRIALGVLLGALYLTFAVAVVALVATLVRGVLPVVAVTLGALLALPIVGALPHVGRRLPSDLAGSLALLATGSRMPGSYVGSAVITVGATAAAVLIATARTGSRDL